jgi:CDP-glycerol glycerophosphotransferase (TagB/SpsB family)
VGESVAPLVAVAAHHAHAHLFTPELAPGAMTVATTAADVDRLAALLTHADVLVNVFSTTTLEAFLVDTPVVSLSEAVGRPANRSRPGGVRAWDEFAHLEGIQRAGATRVARSLDELVAEVAAYLADPARDRDARARAVRDECGPLDGHSGERVAGLLLAAPVRAR